ncbi:hypothetical protein DL89DRAFT_269729 [Linderina pennispora]|uniref:Uncharacterized protein n=1 Tax=Linderina pennispora TaxID=61395 RepID=A0A1Y1W1C3_9FUNG|nr:uncharacterized protein DL89DRAFT_269729 [Linderina pennispora]ORX67310.1 hypothetical protein DL89DRAFT_269729 [Linderina pennispora]
MRLSATLLLFPISTAALPLGVKGALQALVSPSLIKNTSPIFALEDYMSYATDAGLLDVKRMFDSGQLQKAFDRLRGHFSYMDRDPEMSESWEFSAALDIATRGLDRMAAMYAMELM